MDHQLAIHHLHGRNTDLAGLLGSKGGLREAWSHVCPCWPGSGWGWGMGRNHTGLKFPLLARRGRRRGGPWGKGRVGGRTKKSGPRASEKGLCRCGAPRDQSEPPHSEFSNGQEAGHRPPRFSEVAGILTQEVSAQALPPQRQHSEPHLSLHSAWTLPQVPEGWVGRELPVGSRDRLGRWRRQREKISNFGMFLRDLRTSRLTLV